MGLPQQIIGSRHRGTKKSSLVEISKRINSLAVVISKESVPEINLNRPDLLPSEILHGLSFAKGYKGPFKDRPKLFMEEFSDLINEIEGPISLRWLDGTVRTHLRNLEFTKGRFLEKLGQLHSISSDYISIRDSLPQETKFVNPSRYGPGPLRETKKSRDERTAQARIQVSEKMLDAILLLPNSSYIIDLLAISKESGRLAIESTAEQARSGLIEFYTSIYNNPENIWRYPPIIVGTLSDLGLVRSDNYRFQNFILKYAKFRSEDQWADLKFVAGVGLTALPIVLGAAGILVAALGDLALGSHSAWQSYEKIQQYQLALKSQNFGTGQPFTNDPENYGSFGLELAFAFLSAFEVLKLAKGIKFAGKSLPAPMKGDRPTTNGGGNLESEIKVIGNGLSEIGSNSINQNGLRIQDSLESPIDSVRRLSGTEGVVAPEFNSSTTRPKGFEASPRQRGLKKPRREVKPETRRRRELKRYKELEEQGIEATAYRREARPRQHKITKAEQLTGISLDEVYRRRIRGKTPPKHLTIKAQRELKLGEPDPALGESLGDVLSDGLGQADHIVAVERIRQFPGFEQLTEVNQISVLNLEVNFVTLSPQANRSKGAKSFLEWTHHEELGVPVNRIFKENMLRKEQKIIPKIQRLIDQLLQQQWKY